MLDESYLILGLDALSRAHTSDYFRDGHLGASVIAAYYFCHENGLDGRTQDAVKSWIDRELRGTPLFLPSPNEVPDPSLLGDLLNALSTGIEDLREVGHNVIFGSAALKALRQLPEAVAPARVGGLCRLANAFASTQNIALEEDDEIPGLGDERQLIEFIFQEYLRSIVQYAGYGQGWAGHLLTFGHAVIELSRLGYTELASGAHEAYRMYIRTMRRGPSETSRRIPDHPSSQRSPLQYEYWEQRTSVRSGLGHAFKYAYSFYNLLGHLDDSELKQRSLAESHKIL